MSLSVFELWLQSVLVLMLKKKKEGRPKCQTGVPGALSHYTEVSIPIRDFSKKTILLASFAA